MANGPDRDLSGDLWLVAEDVRQRVGAYLHNSAPQRLTLDDVALEVFGVQHPNRSVKTQIGKAMTFLGWRRIEQRTKKPRYFYEPE